MMSDLVEHTLETSRVWQGKLLDVHVDTVRLPNHEVTTREYICHPGAVVIIPVLDNGNLIFERQHRYPLGQDFIELPAGKIDPQEPPARTAVRELLEETGYEAAHWRHLGVMHPCIGYSNERIEIYLASGLTLCGQQLDEHEFLEVIELSLEESFNLIRSGELTDAKTITALFWAERALQHGW